MPYYSRKILLGNSQPLRKNSESLKREGVNFCLVLYNSLCDVVICRLPMLSVLPLCWRSAENKARHDKHIIYVCDNLTYPDFQALSLVWTKAHWRRSDASTARRRGAAGRAAGHDPVSSAGRAVAAGGESAAGRTASFGGDALDADGDAGVEYLASVGCCCCCWWEWDWERTTLNICSSGGAQLGDGRFAADNQQHTQTVLPNTNIYYLLGRTLFMCMRVNCILY